MKLKVVTPEDTAAYAEREKRILDLRAEGKTNKEIATLAGLSVERVRQIVLKAQRRLEVAERRQRAEALPRDKWLDADIEDVNEWSIRVRNCLKNAGINSVRELLAYTQDELLEIPNFAKSSLAEVEGFLTDHGYVLGAWAIPRPIKDAIDRFDGVQSMMTAIRNKVYELERVQQSFAVQSAAGSFALNRSRLEDLEAYAKRIDSYLKDVNHRLSALEQAFVLIQNQISSKKTDTST